MLHDLPLIILPGNMCDERAYASQHSAFAGRETIFADLTRDPSISAMAKRVLRSAPDRFLVFGHSMGGITALELIRLAPERVTGAIMVATNAMAETDERRADRLALVAELDTSPLDEIVKKRLIPHYFLRASQDLADLVVDMAVTLGAETFRSQAQALMNRMDSRLSLTQFSLPVLLLGGRHDKLVPPERVRDMKESISNAAYEIIENSAHFPGLEKPAEVNARIMSWLNEHNF